MNRPLRCLLVDDKPLALDLLTDYVSQVPFLHLVGALTNPLDALALVDHTAVDLILLDIQMPHLTGLQFLKALNGRLPVILTTAYAEYALDGFEHDVIDYLLKPISFERFYRAVKKAQDRLQAPVEQSASARPFLFVKTDHRLQRVDLPALLYIEGLQNYTVLHLATEKIIARQTVSHLAQQLPAEAFIRVHKSFIVALAHISSVERSRISIQRAEGEAAVLIPVGDRYRDAFYQRLGGNT